MDFIYFAINAGSLGLAALLFLSHSAQKKRAQAKLATYLISVAAAAIYYGLNQLIFSKYLIPYLIANLLPIFLLTGVVIWVFRNSPAAKC